MVGWEPARPLLLSQDHLGGSECASFLYSSTSRSSSISSTAASGSVARGGTGNADLTGDGTVNGADLGILLGAWGACASCAADMNGDGMVDGLDLGSMLGAWS